jgi:hypothetical protein
MTRITVDSATAARIKEYPEPLEIYDEKGNLIGLFEPNEKSPAVREFLKNYDSGLTEEEMQRRVAEALREGITTDQVIERLRGRKREL